ncbi:hypothetical protein OUZ56_001649 [Daphnia magna]|uniref:Uncharacterized protein n=1 Tax=Daphnia magna TaxID=35525 RepID=A0ABR0A3B9_9CRUS|nr:hypothetical protein OUZ56_001649 [Daphnia magna]
MQSCSRRNMAWLCYHVFHLRFDIPILFQRFLEVSSGLWDVPDVLWWLQNHSMTWFNPGLEILEAPDVFHWRWSHSVAEENATHVMLSV